MSVKFQIGDRVRCIRNYPADHEGILIGNTGTVCDITEVTSPHVGVSWDHEISHGHNCNGNCPRWQGWYVDESDIEPISEVDSDVDIPEVYTDAISALFQEVV